MFFWLVFKSLSAHTSNRTMFDCHLFAIIAFEKSGRQIFVTPHSLSLANRALLALLSGFCSMKID